MGAKPLISGRGGASDVLLLGGARAILARFPPLPTRRRGMRAGDSPERPPLGRAAIARYVNALRPLLAVSCIGRCFPLPWVTAPTVSISACLDLRQCVYLGCPASLRGHIPLLGGLPPRPRCDGLRRLRSADERRCRPIESSGLKCVAATESPLPLRQRALRPANAGGR